VSIFQRIAAIVCLLSVLAGVSFSTTSFSGPTAAIPADYFGMSENQVAGSSPFPAVAFKTLRMWDVGTRWSQIETSNGYYNWSKADKVVNLALSNGKDIMYTFGGTPTWASSNPTQACLYGYGSCASPKYMSDLADFARQLATRYKGKIKYYELWNEPNDTHYYTGSMSAMVTMSQTIRDAVKSVDPTAIVLSPCPTWSSSGSPTIWLASYLSAGGGAYFDIASYHAYAGPNAPEFIVNSVQGIRNTLTNAGYGSKKIYITEGGWGQNKYLTSTDLQSNFLARYYVLAWGKGLSKMVWYSYDNSGWDTLWTSTSGLLPPGNAYKQVVKWMTGATMTNCAQDSNSTWSCSLTRPNGYAAKIIWNPAKTTGFNVPTSMVRKWTLSGSLSNFSGGYVTVGPKPILVENMAGF
jgi:cellulase (glycosyl hydrolase family 5)